MSLKWIRDNYNVPAYRGQRVRYKKHENREGYTGVITSAKDGYI
jgi:hypothetical protein